jgi:hypothetical protein
MRKRGLGLLVFGIGTAVATAYGCGLAFDIDPPVDGGFVDAPTNTTTGTTPPPKPDSAIPDAEVDAMLDAGPDAYPIDDDASFDPSNLDAAADAYSLESDADLQATGLVVKKPVNDGAPPTVTVSSGPKIDPSWIRYEPGCGCVVLSLRYWNVPAGKTLKVETEVPLVVVARDVRIDGDVVVVLANVNGPSFGKNGLDANSGSVGGSGGGSLTAGGFGGARNASTPGPAGGPAQPDGTILPIGSTGGSGSGSGSGCGNGGNGGGSLEIHGRIVNVNGTLSASGLGGEKGCANGSGAGGGSAGTLFIEGRYVDLTRGRIFATGGGGGGGNNGANGGGGAQAGGSGGAGGGGSGAGGRGGDGVNAPEDGGTAGDAGGATRGGGGGGSAGFVRVRRLAGPDGGNFTPKPVFVPN